MSTNNRQGNQYREDSCYFEEVSEYMEDLKDERERLSRVQSTIQSIEELLATIDCDMGAGSIEIEQGIIEVSFVSCRITGAADDLIKVVEWDSENLYYNNEHQYYEIELSLDLS